MSNVYRNLKQIMGPLVFDVMISKIQLFGVFHHNVRLDFGLFFYHKVSKILTYLFFDAFKLLKGHSPQISTVVFFD